MQLKMYQIDAFTNEIFKGNPAAVVPLETWLSDENMQSIAMENNLSETAFFVLDSNGIYHIRWFSPVKEIDFCGHATLASAYVIFEARETISRIVFFAKAVGELTVIKSGSGVIEMSFPKREPANISYIPKELLEGLSLKPAEVLRNQQAYFALYETEEQVRSVVPALQKLAALGPFDVVITAPGIEHDFVSRYFWPANGGNEDPVTGSIHAGLAPFWAKRLSKNDLVAQQASTRSGTLYCRVTDDRVYVSGYAKKYLL
jgi:PhzF family phenazine biosynthesis protein